MGCKWCTIFLAILAAWLGYNVHNILYTVPELPKLSEPWWGPGDISVNIDESIRPFKIDFKEEVVGDLQQRLNNAKFYTESLEGVGFQYGFNNKYLGEIMEFWKNEYKFSERENYINQYPHFKTKIQGLDIHYVHVKPKNVMNMKVYPLLLLHGWPGSFIEFYKLIPLLTSPRKGYDYIFELIIPSLPGYGFSQASAKVGLGEVQVSTIMKNLMKRLGLKNYIIQGGDWGAIITSHMALFYPDDIFGYHTNLPINKAPLSTLKVILGSVYPSLIVEKEHESKLYPYFEKIGYLLEETGYFHLQATKPDTLGVALRDSPVGLAAYILEKFSTWTNREWRKLNDGGLTKKYTLTELLDNIMIYWVSNSITTSVRLYSESFNKKTISLNLDSIPINVPTAVTRCAHELAYTPTVQIKDRYHNLIQITDYPDCGHFLAFEEPEYLANDLWNAVMKFESSKNS